MRPFSVAVHNSCITGFDFNFNLSYSWTSSEHCTRSLFPVRSDSNKGSAGPASGQVIGTSYFLAKGKHVKSRRRPAADAGEMDRNYKL